MDIKTTAQPCSASDSPFNRSEAWFQTTGRVWSHNIIGAYTWMNGSRFSFELFPFCSSLFCDSRARRISVLFGAFFGELRSLIAHDGTWAMSERDVPMCTWCAFTLMQILFVIYLHMCVSEGPTANTSVRVSAGVGFYAARCRSPCRITLHRFLGDGEID